MKESNGAEGRIEAMKDGPQIVVTVDGLSSSRHAPSRLPRDRKIKVGAKILIETTQIWW